MDPDEMRRRAPPPAGPEPGMPEPAKPEPAKPKPGASNPRGSGSEAEEPAAGPHARPGLTDTERTPGAGALADPDEPKDQDATG